MISRRDVVTAGVLGTLAAPAAAEVSNSQESDAQTRAVLTSIQKELARMTGVLEDGLVGPNTAHGNFLGEIRNRFTVHLRSAGKFPDFLEIGTDPFYAVYDWHVRHSQQIQITRISEQRFAIQWMFTQLIVRFEQDARYIGVPFDRA
jgi:hypothetical protein